MQRRNVGIGGNCSDGNITEVHKLSGQGLTQRAIARQTGHSRKTIKCWLARPIPDLPEGIPEQLSEFAKLLAPQQRRRQRQKQHSEVHGLRKQGLSYSEIARRTGLHRVTVKRWLQDPSSLTAFTFSESHLTTSGPPAPWASWEEVHQIREILHEKRCLLLRRPEHLNDGEAQLVQMLLASPVGKSLQTARNFLIGWYRLWTDAVGQRRSPQDAHICYEAWHANDDYHAMPQLQVVLSRITAAKFERLSQFLYNPKWEATNNGAERAGRAFRHRQAPYYNLRSTKAIPLAIAISAVKRKDKATSPINKAVNRCSRGRKQRSEATCAVAV